MNKLCIFCIYDSEGRVYPYVENLLQQISLLNYQFYITVNGILSEDSYGILKKYSKDILIRENKGYDGGAYRDAILHIGKNRLMKYDEVILCNDSFFGFFMPIESIFLKMSQTADFWGIRYINNGTVDYIESYFLVFDRKIVESGNLYDFFFESSYMEYADYYEICSCFERGIFAYLKNKGYSYSAVTENHDYDSFESADINVIEYKVPILKKRVLDLKESGKEQLKRICAYLEENTEYPISYILEYMREKKHMALELDDLDYSYLELHRKERLQILKFDCNREQLLRFLEDNSNVYIYGAGFHAGNIWFTYKYKIKEFGGFIQSDQYMDKQRQYFNESIIPFSEIPKGSNIILALNEKFTREVYGKVKDDYNVFVLWNIG